jgi:hypothetical protein
MILHVHVRGAWDYDIGDEVWQQSLAEAIPVDAGTSPAVPAWSYRLVRTTATLYATVSSPRRPQRSSTSSMSTERQAAFGTRLSAILRLAPRSRSATTAAYSRAAAPDAIPAAASERSRRARTRRRRLPSAETSRSVNSRE